MFVTRLRGIAATTIAVLLALAASASAQDNRDEESCPDGGYNPTPVEVAVTTVPIVVTSTTADYFVLYVKHDADGTEVELPALVKRGAAGTTTLAENVTALPAERYRVEKYAVADPADVDGDCIDDLTELADPVGKNPVNPTTPVVLISDGAVAIPDRATFDTLAVAQLYVKFIILDIETVRPAVYFMNTNTSLHHNIFVDNVLGGQTVSPVTGQITYHPDLVGPSGRPGFYSYWLWGTHSFSSVVRLYTLLAASLPLLENNFVFYVDNDQLQRLQADMPLYRASRIPLASETDLFPEDFLSLNPAEGYGRLRALDLDERPHPRDVVLYEALPNELPRVAGIISTVPQTPLSHVNLRAVQDRVPNAFVRDALDSPFVTPLLNGYVHYTVTSNGWGLRAATVEEVDAHYASSRPSQTQTPERDLSVTEITSLSEIGFEAWDAFGVKAANVAVLGTLGFPAGTVPDGYAIPFYFYDEFMKANDFYDDIREMLADSDFQTNFDTQEEELKKLRKAIEDAETPQWIIAAIEAMNTAFDTAFGAGLNRRYRSSTNNEDLPGFNGAGLYDSKSQKPSEDEEDLAKSLKEVYASLWNFRAFVEREFHRVDHLSAAMGILVHPSYQDELVNGVAVSFNPISYKNGHYYVNSQIGEDLVTNPEAHSVPEELLLRQNGTYIVLTTSNQAEPGQLLMSEDQLDQLYRHFTVIHDHFKGLYEPEPDDPFAMEIEFKITSENILAIKQARPWVGDTERGPPPPRERQNIPLVGLPSLPPSSSLPSPRLDCTAAPDRHPNILWESTMTVGAALPADRGFRAGMYGELCRTFAYQGEQYTLTGLYHDRDVRYVLRSVFLTATRPLPDDLLLWVDDRDTLLLFRSSDATSQGNTLEWSRLDPALSWAAGAQFLVRLTKAVGAPGRVPGVTVAEQIGALSVSWQEMSIAERYRVEWKAEGENYSPARQHEVAWNAPLSVTIPNPEAGLEYTVRVTALNAEGKGPPVEGSGTPQVARPPGAGNFWAATLTVAVHESSVEGRQTGFSAVPAPGFGHLDPTLFTQAGVTHTVQRLVVLPSGELLLWSNKALPAGVTLHIGPREFATSDATPHRGRKVLIWSGSGLSWAAGATVAVRLTGPATAPGPPRQLRATAAGQHTIALEWLAPLDDGGSEITGYQLQVASDGSTWSSVGEETPGLTYPAPGLRAATTYRYRVAARYGAGLVGPYSQTAQATTAAAPPPPRRGGGGGGGGGGSGGDGGGGEPEPEPEPVGSLENPGPASFQSGVGVISGWVCDADRVEIEIAELPAQGAAYGTERLDTESVCGDTDNGFGLLFNWNLLGDGTHTVVTVVDGVELDRATVTVTTLGEEFVRGVAGTCEVEDFPSPGETVTLVWQQPSQNFVIAGGSPPAGDNAPRPDALTGFLENPGPNSFQSGISVLSGWVCEADRVELAIGTAGRQVAAYGTERGDTLDTCGDTNNGFGLLFNWNLLGDGEHAVVAYVDDMELGRATVQVTTLGAEFLRGVEGECVVADFPMLGETVVLEWQQNSQNFVITEVE